MSKLTDLVRPLLLFSNVTGLTGGGATKLDGIATLSLTVGIRGFINVAETIYFYELQAGTDAEASPTVIRPDDYAGGTNEKVWQLLGITGGGGTFLVAANNLSDLVSAASARANLDLEPGVDVQAYDAELAALAGLTSAADKVPYFTGSGTAAVADFSGAGRALVDDADATAQRATLGLVIGTNVQAYDAELAALAGLTSAADKMPYFTGSGTAAMADLTSAGRALIDDADASAQRTTLGLGNALKTAIPFVIDGGGVAITTGSKGAIPVPAGMTVTAWRVFADQTGSIVVDVKKATYSGLPTFSSIAASAKPTLSAAQKNEDTTLTGWTTSLSEGDWLEFVVDSAATVQRVTVVLICTKT